ncbi:MAG: phosphotransferase [Clostridium sp.]
MHLDSKISNYITNSLKWNVGFITKILKLNGLNNYNYKMNYLGMDYFLSLKGENFSKECLPFYKEVLNLTNSQEISYNIVHLDENTGDLLTHWLDGDTPDYETLNSEAFIESLCFSLKRFHSLKIDKEKNPFKSIHTRYNKCIDNKIDFPVDMAPLLVKSDEIYNTYKNDTTIGLCHYDLNPSNIIYDNKKCFIIDLEFSAMGDIFWDLATISWMMDENSKKILLSTYFGECNDYNLKKLNNYLFSVKLWNALWSLLKSVEPYSNFNYSKGAEIILKEIST